MRSINNKKQSTKRIIQTTRPIGTIKNLQQQKLETTKLGNLESELLETNKKWKHLKKKKMQRKERLGFWERKERFTRGVCWNRRRLRLRRKGASGWGAMNSLPLSEAPSKMIFSNTYQKIVYSFLEREGVRARKERLRRRQTESKLRRLGLSRFGAVTVMSVHFCFILLLIFSFYHHDPMYKQCFFFFF